MTTPTGDDPNRPQPGYGTPAPGGDQPAFGHVPGAVPPPGAEYLGSTILGDPPPAKGRRNTWIAAGVATAVLVGAGTAGAVVVGRALGGGGAHPASALPAGAVAYVEFDLDPGAGQKLGAIRFLRKFPDTRGKFAEDRDLRRSLWDLAALTDSDTAKIDYQRDIAPWIGSRIGVAVMAPSGGTKIGENDVVAAVAVTDEKKARAGIAKLDAADPKGDPTHYAFNDGYAIVAKTQAVADGAVAAAKKADLAGNARFAADLKDLGERGVSSGWLDLDALRRYVPQARPDLSSSLALAGNSAKGRVAYSVRFVGDDLEMVAKGHGLDTSAPKLVGKASTIAKLPATSMAALGLADGEHVVTNAWSQLPAALASLPMLGGGSFDDSVAAVEAQTGLKLPGDLAVLFGKDFALGVDGSGLTSGTPKVGVRAVTDGARAEKVLTSLINRALGGSAGPVPVTVTRTDDGYVAASDPTYAAALAKGGTLGETTGFRAALPDLGSAQVAMFVDVDGLVKATGSGRGRAMLSGTQLESALAIDAVGLTASSDGKGEATLRLKVVTR